jgi:dTDP-4-dehydrorhamnose reductase
MSGLPRVLIVGNAGQVGVELQRSFQGCGELAGVDRESVDLAQADQVRALVRRFEPDVILNAAAYTAVDRAETEPELAWAINAQAPRILAEEALHHNALLVHYSTDYIFDGSKQDPWTEQDAPAPLNAYGASKLGGEVALREVGGKVLVFRTSWVYGPHGSNFLLTMLRLGRQRDSISVVGDQVGSPTTSIELARATRVIVDGVIAGRFGAAEDWAGLYHMTCSGSTSWCGFAQAIFARAEKILDGKIPQVTPITSEEYPTPAKRPRNSVLSNAKLEQRFGVRLDSWESALDAVIQALEPAKPHQP